LRITKITACRQNQPFCDGAYNCSGGRSALHTVDFHNWVTISNATGMPPCKDGRMAAPTVPGLGVIPMENQFGKPIYVAS